MSAEPLIWTEKAPLVPPRAPALPTPPTATAPVDDAVSVEATAVTRGVAEAEMVAVVGSTDAEALEETAGPPPRQVWSEPVV